jgi:hypothetical protein
VAFLGCVMLSSGDGGAARLDMRGTCITHDKDLSSSLFPTILSTCFSNEDAL